MIERRKGHVEAVTPIKDVDTNLTQFVIQIDFDEYIVFYDRAALLEFAGKDVYYVTRTDVV